jgi:hypothetical protein
MTFPFHASGHVYGIRAVFNRLQQMNDVHPSGAGHLDDLDVAGIGESHGTCQVRSGVRSVLAAIGKNLGFEVTHISHTSFLF